DACNHALKLEAAIDAAKAFESALNGFDRNIEADADGDGRSGIEDVVGTGYVEHEFPQVFRPITDAEVGQRAMLARLRFDGTRPDEEVGPAARTVGQDATLHLRQKLAQDRVVIAGDDHAVERDTIHEFQERLADIAHVAVTVHVFAVDIRDDGKNWRKLKK